MKLENRLMIEFLRCHGIEARVKYIATGSIAGCWRLYNPNVKWHGNADLIDKLNRLEFRDFDGKPLSNFSGNGGIFSVFVRGHYELLPLEMQQSDLISIRS